jgi:hypothetical protein
MTKKEAMALWQKLLDYQCKYNTEMDMKMLKAVFRNVYGWSPIEIGTGQWAMEEVEQKPTPHPSAQK